MHKETTVLFVCLLILLADILSIRQIINFWLSEEFFVNRFPVIALLVSLGVFAVLLSLINYTLIRKIIGKRTI